MTYYLETFFLAYFFSINTIYLLLSITALFAIKNYMEMTHFTRLGGELSEVMPPITVLVPAFNEENSIVETARSLSQLRYPNLELIVIDDGSTDKTADRLINSFDMKESLEKYREEIKTRDLNTIYRSQQYDNLKLVRKENGGKADALNVGINIARSPLICCIDGDSVLEPESLTKIVQPFLLDSRTVASGGTVRVANGCQIKDGFMLKAGLPNKFLPLLQVLEYLRAFLFGRMGWEPLNGLMIISGAFGVFKRKTLLEIGGYHTDNVAEDMEVIIRLHRRLSEEEKNYRIHYVPDPVCWTEVPSDINSLRSQRIRWQHGLMQSTYKNISLLFKSGSGAAGWLAFPYQLIFEGLGAAVETVGYFYLGLGIIFGFTAPPMAIAFFFISIAYGIFLSVITFLIEVISFDIYKSREAFSKLFLAALLENLGYRQVNSLWRFYGLLRSLRKGSGSWGEISKKGFD